MAGFETGEKYDFRLAVAVADGSKIVNMLDGIAIMKYYYKWAGFERFPLRSNINRLAKGSGMG